MVATVLSSLPHVHCHAGELMVDHFPSYPCWPSLTSSLSLSELGICCGVGPRSDSHSLPRDTFPSNAFSHRLVRTSFHPIPSSQIFAEISQKFYVLMAILPPYPPPHRKRPEYLAFQRFMSVI